MYQLEKSVSSANLGLFMLLGLFLLAANGCSQSTVMDAETLAAYRTELSLSDEPEGVQTVADVRETLLGEDHDDHDHDGDGHPDHEAADHDEDGEDHEDGLEEDGHDEEGHDEEGEEHAEHDDEDEGHEGEDRDVEHGTDDHGHVHETEPQEVVMVGHVGGLANPWAEAQPDYPFAKDAAVFFLADPLAVVENEASGHSHAPGEECAFCAAHAADKADMLAMVQFVDKNGKVLPTDVRQLFDVKEQDTVVVRGQAHVTAGGILVLNAEGLYVRK